MVLGFTNPSKAISKLGKFCFTEGTQVVVGMEYDADGNFVQYVTMNIEDIKVGDLVYSYDTITGEVSLKAVTATSALRSGHINYLTIIDEHGNEQVIETTDTHPFWVVTDDPDLERAAREIAGGFYHENIAPGLNGFWVEAKDLRAGDVFLGANGELSTLTNIVRVEQAGGIAVFNFTVEGNHNYFILAKEYEYGQTAVLVHNAKLCDLYVGVCKKTGKPYYGISNNVPRRTSEHLNNKKNPIQIVKTLLKGLTRPEARAAEQLMISSKKLANLANKINSISPKKLKEFAAEIAKATERLKKKGLL